MKKNNFRVLIMAILMFWLGAGTPSLAAADIVPADDDDPPLTAEEQANLMGLQIRAGTGVRVKSFDKKSQTFLLEISDEKGVGPNITTMENLMRAMNLPATARTIGQPQEWVGKKFNLVQDLTLVPEPDDEPAPVRHSKKKPRK